MDKKPLFHITCDKIKGNDFHSPMPHSKTTSFSPLHILMIWASVSVPGDGGAVRWLRSPIHSNEHSYIFICGLTFTLSPQKVLKLSGIIINFYHKTVITLFTSSATVAFLLFTPAREEGKKGSHPVGPNYCVCWCVWVDVCRVPLGRHKKKSFIRQNLWFQHLFFSFFTFLVCGCSRLAPLPRAHAFAISYVVAFLDIFPVSVAGLPPVSALWSVRAVFLFSVPAASTKLLEKLQAKESRPSLPPLARLHAFWDFQFKWNTEIGNLLHHFCEKIRSHAKHKYSYIRVDEFTIKATVMPSISQYKLNGCVWNFNAFSWKFNEATI